MWSSPGGWGQWPPNPLSNMSGEEVDWASLAKQWIAQRDVMSSSSVADLDGLPSSSHAAVGALQPPPPPPPPPPSDAKLFHLQVPDNTNTVDSCNSQDSGDFGSVAQPVGVPPENWENWSNPGWGMPGWVVPPPPPPVSDNGNNMFPGEHYQPVENMPPAYGFDQNFGAFYDPSFNQAHGNFQYWNAANSHHPAAAAPIPLQSAHAYDFRPASKKGSAVPVNAMPSMPSLMDDNFLDMAKRRQLPAWIREGLEKMEREKLRQQEKEKNPSSDGQSGRQAGDDASRENPLEPAKSRFDSDDDSDNEVDSTAAQPEDTIVKRASPVVEEQKATVMSEEERQVQIMIRVRQMLTEVLLDVTNQEIHAMVRSVLKSAKIKQARAPAKQLAKSSALASITSLGLGYGSESESEEIEDKPSSESSGEASETSEDEDTVRLRIAVKKREFAKKMSRLEETEEEQVPSRVQQLNRKVSSDDASRPAENTAVHQHSPPPNLRSDGDRMHAGDVPLANEPRHKGRHFDEVKKVAESQPTTKKRASIESASESKSSDDDDDDESESRQSRLSRSLDDRMVGRGSAKYEANDRTKNTRVAEDSFDRNSAVGKSSADSSKRKDRIHSEKSDIDKNAAIADSNRKKSNRHDFDDSYARHRSRSRDRSSGKSKRSHHKSSKKKRDESADFESHHDSRGKQLDRSVSKSSSHKSRKRSYSSSDSSDDYESHRHRRRSSKSGRDRPKQQHRRRSSSSPEGIKGGNSGKKLHAKRKYRSSSRSSDD